MTKMTERQRRDFYTVCSILDDVLAAPVRECCQLFNESQSEQVQGLSLQSKKLLCAMAITNYAMGVVSGYFEGLETDQCDEAPDAPAVPLIPLESIEMSTRVANILRNKGIKYLNELQNFSTIDMIKEPNFGATSLRELQEILTAHGLKLREIYS